MEASLPSGLLGGLKLLRSQVPLEELRLGLRQGLGSYTAGLSTEKKKERKKNKTKMETGL
jgi:hypothetical protein